MWGPFCEIYGPVREEKLSNMWEECMNKKRNTKKSFLIRFFKGLK